MLIGLDDAAEPGTLGGLARAFQRFPQGLAALLETIPCGLFALDEHGRITAWNEHMVRLTGYSVEEVSSRPCTVLEGSTCAGGPCLDTGGCSLFAGEEVRERRCRIRRKDGVWVPVLKNAQAMHDDDGRLIGAIEAITDLSGVLALEEEVARLKREMTGRAGFHRLVGRHPSMQRLYDVIEMASRTPSSVLILGESGVGKELVAHAIHHSSPRKAGPFVRVSCGALSETVLESELFGHVRGAFTGAICRRVGRFEAADGGTLFLDEIGDVSAATQTRLLRVLQEREFERVGDSESIRVDIRVVAATNRDLHALTQTREFREDLYFRLAVIPVEVPPLRERRSDIPLLVDHFIEQLNDGQRRHVNGITPGAMDRLMADDWPGNVRQLRHAIEYGFVLSRSATLDADCLPAHIGRAGARPAPARRQSHFEGSSELRPLSTSSRREGAGVSGN